MDRWRHRLYTRIKTSEMPLYPYKDKRYKEKVLTTQTLPTNYSAFRMAGSEPAAYSCNSRYVPSNAHPQGRCRRAQHSWIGTCLSPSQIGD